MADWRKLLSGHGLRYLPALFLLLCAIAVSLHISGGSGARPHMPPLQSGKPESSEVPVFKSPRRLAAAKVPASRKPIFVTTADKLPITPEEAKEMLREYRNYDNPASRGKSQATVIRRLCHSGYADEAFASIENTPSEARDLNIRSFFLAMSGTDEAILAKAAELPSKEDKAEALGAFFRRMPIGDLSDLLGKQDPIPEEVRLGVSQLFRYKLDNLAERAEATGLAIAYYKQGWLDEELVVRAMREKPGADPFNNWEQLAGSGISKKAGMGLVSEMVDRDPARTLDLLAAGTGKDGNGALAQAILLVARTSPSVALEWFASRESTLPLPQHDVVAAAFASCYMAQGSPDEAENWAARAKDPKSREEIRRFMTTLASRLPSK